MEHSTLCYHLTLHTIIFLPKIAPGAAWPPKNLNSFKKQILKCLGSFIVAAREIDYEP
jgi:hypothetical protein